MARIEVLLIYITHSLPQMDHHCWLQQSLFSTKCSRYLPSLSRLTFASALCGWVGAVPLASQAVKALEVATYTRFSLL